MDHGLETAARGIVERAKAIILTPRDEWAKIAGETTPQREILVRYAVPLAAISPVAAFLAGQIFGYGAFGFTYRPGIIEGLSTALVSFALSLASLFVVTFIAEFLSPKFGGEANRLGAFRLVAYSYTASWLVGIFRLVPTLGFFALLGLYSIYLLYIGATPLLKVPKEKSAAFTAVTILSAAVLAIAVVPLAAAITGVLGFGATSMASNNDAGGKITLPGGSTVDARKMEEMGKQLEGVATGKTAPVEATRMMQLLPTSIGSYQRTAAETVGIGAMGSTAEGTYSSGDKTFKLKVVDMSALGAIAGLSVAMGIERSREDAESYERTGVVNGQMQSESWNRTRSNGKFAVVVANRFMIEAEGDASSVEELKAAVATVDEESLLALAG